MVRPARGKTAQAPRIEGDVVNVTDPYELDVADDAQRVGWTVKGIAEGRSWLTPLTLLVVG